MLKYRNSGNERAPHRPFYHMFKVEASKIQRFVEKKEPIWLIFDREKVDDFYFSGDYHPCTCAFWALFWRSSYFLAILAEKVVTRKKPSLIFN